MRIVYAAAEGLSPGTAAATHVHGLTAGLRDLGHEVDVISGSPRRTGPLWTIVESPLVSWRALRARGVLLVRFHPVLIPLVVTSRMLGRAVVVELNGPPEDLVEAYPFVRSLRRAYSRVVAATLQTSSSVIAVTDVLRDWCHSVGVGRATTVPNGADTDVFVPGAARPHRAPPKYVLFFGSFAPWQGLETLLSARSAGSWPDEVELLIIGRGALQGTVEAAADRDPGVTVLGPMTQPELSRYVSNAVATVCVKDYASGLSPLKVYESLSCGTPVICSNQPGLVEVVEAGEGLGLAIPPGDPTALALAVREISRWPANTEAVRAHAVENHSWRRSAHLVEDVVRDVAVT